MIRLLIVMLIVGTCCACNYAGYLPSPSPTQEPTPTQETFDFICAVVVATDCLNLRATRETNRSDNIVTCMSRGQYVWVSPELQDIDGWSWVEIPSTALIGWAATRLLEFRPGEVC